MMVFDTSKYMPEMIFTKRDNIVKRLSCLTYESFSECVAHWGLGRGFDDFDAFRLHDKIKGKKTAVSVMNDIAAFFRDFVKKHGKVSGLL